MKISKHSLTLGAVALTAGSVLAAGAMSVNAQGMGFGGDMSQKISQRFNLNQAEVESFFEEQREQHQAEMQSKFAENLNQAVTDGKISEEQKTAILAKHEEMQTKMQTRHEEMESWASSNGINLEDLPMLGLGGPRGEGRSQGKGMHAQQ